jgi:type II secretory pathway component GspD/PulD (secretin)
MKKLLTAGLLLWSLFAFAQQSVEIIELHGKSAEEVIPVLRPLLEPGGTISGMNNQLFLRASPRNRADIKRALEALDKPARQLVIQVSTQRQADDSSRGGSVDGQVVIGTRSRVNADARVWDTRSARSDRSGQMIRVLEGNAAFIQIGDTLPIPMRQVVVGPGGAIVNETVVYQDIGRGFYALPRVNGQRVTLDISQHADGVGQYGPGSVHTQRLSTTVSGYLGEWIELGGSGQQGSNRQSGTTGLSTGEIRERRSVWLKVEEVD